MKRLFTVFALCLLLLTSRGAAALTADKYTAKSAIVMERTSGRVLFALNERQKLPMASTTNYRTVIPGTTQTTTHYLPPHYHTRSQPKIAHYH